MHGEYKVHGGKLVVIDLEVQDNKLNEVQVAGDFFSNLQKPWMIFAMH